MDLWGGRVVMAKEEINPKMPKAPVEYTKDLSCPLLGIFGEEDTSPTPQQVSQTEQEMKKHHKSYEFHMYPEAGHGFFYYDRPSPAGAGGGRLEEGLGFPGEAPQYACQGGLEGCGVARQDILTIPPSQADYTSVLGEGAPTYSIAVIDETKGEQLCAP